MGSKTPTSLPRRIIYSVLVLAFLIGFLAGMVFQNSDYYQGKFNIRGTRTTIEAPQTSGPDMATDTSGPDM